MEAPDLNISITRENIPDVNNDFFEVTTTLFAVPPVDDSVQIVVRDTSRYAPGMYLYFANIGTFKITALVGATVLTIRNVTATAGDSVSIGTVFQSTGEPYTPGDVSTDERAYYDTLAQTFNAPSAGGTTDLYVVNGGWFTANLWIFVPGLGWYKIASLDAGDNTHCVVSHVNTDTSLATLGSTGGSASAGQPVIVQPPPQFRPDDSTVKAVNASSTPGDSTLKVADNFLNNRLFVQGVTSPRMEFGGASVTAPGVGDDQLLVTVTFAEEFSSAPVVQGLTIESDANLGSNLLDLALYVRDVSSTGFKIYGTVATGAVAADFVVNWTAIGA